MNDGYKDDNISFHQKLVETMLSDELINQIQFLLHIISSNCNTGNRKDYYKAVKIVTSLIEDRENNLTLSDFDNFDFLNYLIYKVDKEPLAVINNINLIFSLIDRFTADAVFNLFESIDSNPLFRIFNIIDHNEMRMKLLDFIVFIEQRISSTNLIDSGVVYSAKPEVLARISRLYLSRIEASPEFIKKVFNEVSLFITSKNSETHRNGLMCVYYGLKGDVTEILDMDIFKLEYNFDDDRPETVEPMLLIYGEIADKMKVATSIEVINKVISFLNYRTVSARIAACNCLGAIFRASHDSEIIPNIIPKLTKYARRARLNGQVAACEAFAAYILAIPASDIDSRLDSFLPLIALTTRVLANSERQDNILSALELLHNVFVRNDKLKKFKELLTDVDIEALEGESIERIEKLLEDPAPS